MITITNKRNYSEVSSDTKYVHKLNTDTYYKKGIEIGTVTEDMFEEVDEVPKYTREEYKIKVRELIAERYDIEDEIALINNARAGKSEEALSKYADYQLFREECKVRAKQELNNNG